MVTVFFSYAHESSNGDRKHQDAVLKLAKLTHNAGINVRLDQWQLAERKEWDRWVREQINNSDFTLVIASPAYRKVSDAKVTADANRGLQAEEATLREHLYSDRAKWFKKILPVVLPGRSTSEIPLFLQPNSGDHYKIETLDQEGVKSLLRALKGIEKRQPPPTAAIPSPPHPGGHPGRNQPKIPLRQRNRKAWSLAIATVIVATLGAGVWAWWPEKQSNPTLIKETAANHSGVKVFGNKYGKAVEAPPIPFGTEVLVRCVEENASGMSSVTAFYLIDSPSPWSNVYAVSDSFANGDVPDGRAQTKVDQAVPKCPN